MDETRQGEPADSGRAEGAATALVALSRAVGVYRLYPRPLGQPGFASALESLRDAIGASGPLTLRVLRDRFSLGDESLEGSDAVGLLASGLFERDVTGVELRAAPDLQELAALAEMVVADPASIEAEGGPGAFLKARGVLSIRVTARELDVRDIAAPPGARLPEPVRSLLSGGAQLAEGIEGQFSPAEAFEHLRQLLGEGLQAGVEEADLKGQIGDTIAAMSTSFRAEVLELAIRALPEEFAGSVVGQLSDGEIAEGLAALASHRGTSTVLAYAVQVVAHSAGRRGELPVVVGRRLIDQGFSREEILNAFGTSRLLSYDEEYSLFSLEALAQRVEESSELAALRAEAQSPGSERDLAEGAAVFKALIRAENEFDDFIGLVEFVEASMREDVLGGETPRALALLEVLVDEAGRESNGPRKVRLEQAIRSAASGELVAGLMAQGGPGDPSARRMLDLLQERSIPALLAQLADETDRGKRKVLVDMLAEVALKDLAILYPALRDPRWYFVRNVVTILGATRAPAVAPYLAPLIGHPDHRVRRETVRALAGAGGESVVATIARALDDLEEGVRLAALSALGSLDSSNATAALFDFARAKRRPARERSEALVSIALSSSEEAIRFLRRVAQRKWPPTQTTRLMARRAEELLARKSAG